MIRVAAELTVRLAAALLPAPLRGWGRAMAGEARAIGRPIAALRFALGCLGCALREAIFFHLLTLRPQPDAADTATPSNRETPPMPMSNRLAERPQLLAMFCAAGATGLGLAYMTVAGAPIRYLAINGVALVLGCLVLTALRRTFRPSDAAQGAIALLLAGSLLLTALLGVSADGVTRWISAGGVPLQPSLMLLPLLALGFARKSDSLSTLAVAIAALALALAPDRAMAGALAAGMVALALVRPGRHSLIALGAALAAFAATLLRPDRSPAMPFVDQILFSSFDVHPLAGAAVVGGAALLLVPAIVGLVRDPEHRAAYAMFGAVWLAVILAAALGNYPTPLVGYSGSAVLGYLLSVIGLPSSARDFAATRETGMTMPELPGEPENRRTRLSYSA
jgi:hypothetical protein